jgi:hypothetical protein
MKKPVHFFAILTLLAACSPEMGPDQVLIWRPEKAQAGTDITILYNPASPGAALREPQKLTARVLVLSSGQRPQTMEKLMEPKGKIWHAQIAVPPDAQMLLAILIDGGRHDDNRGRGWENFLYGMDERPVSGAHLQKSLLLQRGGTAGFPYRRNLREAETELEAELTLHPQNLQAKTALWDLLLRQYPAGSIQERVRKELRQTYEEAAGDEETLAALLPFFVRTGQEYIARQIIEESVALLPRGPVAAAARRLEIGRESDPIKKAALVAAFAKDFPGQTLEK